MTARRVFVVVGTHVLTTLFMTLFMTAMILRKLVINAWRLVRFCGGLIRTGAQHFWRGIGRAPAIVFFAYAVTALVFSYGRIVLEIW